MKSPIEELIEVFEDRDMSITEFYLHFLKNRSKYLSKERRYVEWMTNPNEREPKYKLDENEYTVEYLGEKKVLPRKEFNLLKLFLENKNKVISRDDILACVWEPEVIVIDRTIDVHLCKIKQKFPNIPIVNRKRVGYIWEEN